MDHVVKVKVVSQEGECVASHEVGDSIVFDFDNNEIKGDICLSALYSMFPKIFAIAYGASFPWTDENPTHACPDAFNPVVFEIHKEDVDA